MTKHIAVWMDHKEARVFHIDPDRVDEATVAAPKHSIHHKHPIGSEGEKAHPEDAQRYFHEVARAVADAGALLVVGPSTAKLGFLRHVHKHDHALEPKIVGVETVDHPTDGQMVAYAKKYFARTDRMR